ncbi:hypothetical protein M3Y97_00173200 [Aphelenchoides bicaudatus]|nr:hypothetical protein M3Y97_00173200 [Aphelenchoides bicaudatus]
MAAVEQTPPTNNPFAPEAEDIQDEEPMEVTTNEPTESTQNKDQELPAVKSADNQIQQVAQWTNDELVRLMEVCEQPRTWEARAQSLIEEFGKSHPTTFFSVEACMEKYKRLTGESENKPANKDLLSWIKQFLKRSFNERHSHGEAARLARVRRFYELTMHALNDRLTDAQISELVGIDLYNDFVTNKLTEARIALLQIEPNREGREEWLHADLFSSKLSHEEWKNAKNPEDLVNKLRTQPINKSRLRFQHHPYKLKLLEDMENEKEEAAIQSERQRHDDSRNIRSPAGRRSEALASVDSADQSVDSSERSPLRKKPRKLPDATAGKLDRPLHPTIHIKRENESPEIIFFEPNITTVTSPTRTMAPPPLVISVEPIESANAARRQSIQRKPSDAKSPVPPAEIVPKVEIKREPSVQETEPAQPMEVDENQPLAQLETVDSCIQTLLSIRLPILKKSKNQEAKSTEASTSRGSRRLQANKKTTDYAPATTSPTSQNVTNPVCRQ